MGESEPTTSMLERWANGPSPPWGAFVAAGVVAGLMTGLLGTLWGFALAIGVYFVICFGVGFVHEWGITTCQRCAARIKGRRPTLCEFCREQVRKEVGSIMALDDPWPMTWRGVSVHAGEAEEQGGRAGEQWPDHGP